MQSVNFVDGHCARHVRRASRNVPSFTFVDGHSGRVGFSREAGSARIACLRSQSLLDCMLRHQNNIPQANEAFASETSAQILRKRAF